MNRDRELEQLLVVRAGGPAEFGVQVLARLDHYEARHGNTGWDRPVDELLQEAQEECADVLGWSIGAAAQLGRVDRLRLVPPTAMASGAWRELERLRHRLATGR